jgi:hypothetical protein
MDMQLYLKSSNLLEDRKTGFNINSSQTLFLFCHCCDTQPPFHLNTVSVLGLFCRRFDVGIQTKAVSISVFGPELWPLQPKMFWAAPARD